MKWKNGQTEIVNNKLVAGEIEVFSLILSLQVETKEIELFNLGSFGIPLQIWINAPCLLI